MKVWQCVLWICAITLHSAHSQSPDQDRRIREALDLYNQKDDGQYFYKQLTDIPADILEEGEDSPSVGFLIKETECLKPQDVDLAECDYKKDGEVKACMLYQEEEKTSKTLKCISLTKNSCVKRQNSRRPCRGFFCRVGHRSPISRGDKDRILSRVFTV